MCYVCDSCPLQWFLEVPTSELPQEEISITRAFWECVFFSFTLFSLLDSIFHTSIPEVVSLWACLEISSECHLQHYAELSCVQLTVWRQLSSGSGHYHCCSPFPLSGHLLITDASGYVLLHLSAKACETDMRSWEASDKKENNIFIRLAWTTRIYWAVHNSDHTVSSTNRTRREIPFKQPDLKDDWLRVSPSVIADWNNSASLLEGPPILPSSQHLESQLHLCHIINETETMMCGVLDQGF